MTKRRSGFTLIEILTVMGIVAVLAAIAFPVTVRVRESARSAGCLLNLHQLGLAIHLYAGDADDRAPGPSAYGLKAGHTLDLGFGWAGKVFPYAKAKGTFACGTDDSRPDPRMDPPGASRLSYGANDNLTALDLSQAASASRTVLLFEVTNDHARIDLPDEGERPGVYTQRSAAGNGVRGSLLDAATPWNGRDPSNEVAAHYATGFLDNDEDASLADALQAETGRHRGGANYLALDGHAAWAEPKAVSAGSTAKSSDAAQSSTGCSMLPGARSEEDPCAAGTGHAGHRLTFSSQ